MWGIMKNICLLMIIITEIFRWGDCGKDTKEKVDFKNRKEPKKGPSNKLGNKRVMLHGPHGVIKKKEARPLINEWAWVVILSP